MPEYRLNHSRFDVPTSTWTTFVAENDAEAKRIFEEKYCKEKSISWDDLDLLRIDTPAVAEKTTLISVAKRQGVKKAEIIHKV